MDIKVVVSDVRPCSDLASRLALVYNLLLQLAEEAETRRKIDQQAPSGESLAATPARASESQTLTTE